MSQGKMKSSGADNLGERRPTGVGRDRDELVAIRTAVFPRGGGVSQLAKIARDFAIAEGKPPLEHAVIVGVYGWPIEKVYHLFCSCDEAKERFTREIQGRSAWWCYEHLECRH
jgi:hypothetical protein